LKPSEAPSRRRRTVILSPLFIAVTCSVLPPGCRLIDQGGQPAQQINRARRTTNDMQIDRDDLIHRTNNCISSLEHAASRRAVADGDNPFGVGRGRVGAFQCDLHVVRHGSGHQQHVGVTWGSGKSQSEALHVIDCIVERVDLKLAAVA